MGKINDGIFGAFTGRVGNVVGYSWRGMDLLRKRPRKRSDSSATLPQLEQRERFGLAIKFLTPIKEMVGVYFSRPMKNKSRFNLAVSYNLMNAVIPDPMGGFMIDYPRILISKGELRGVEDGNLTPEPGQAIKMSWTDNSGQGTAAAIDKVVAIVYSPDRDLFQMFNPAGVRGERFATLNLPAFYSGLEVHVWAAMVTDNMKEASLSSYLGSVMVT